MLQTSFKFAENDIEIGQLKTKIQECRRTRNLFLNNPFSVNPTAIEPSIEIRREPQMEVSPSKNPGTRRKTPGLYQMK